MEYDIKLQQLNSKSSELGSISNKVDVQANLIETQLDSVSSADLGNAVSSCKELLTRLKNGCSKSNSWLSEYLNDLNQTETNLISEAEAITQFQGEFENIFAKVTIPTLQTGGDKDANIITSENSLLNTAVTGNTQLSDLTEIAHAAEYGDAAAQKELFDRLSAMADPICKKYGFSKPVLMAQMLQESGWLQSNWLTDQNNVLGVNYDMFGSGDYRIAKDGSTVDIPIPNWASYQTYDTGRVSGGAHLENPREDAMRTYKSIEDCMEDYVALMVGYRPYLNGCDVNTTIEEIKHYAEDVDYASSLHSLIDTYNLEQYS